MAVVTTEGIIVRRSNFGEADRILTIITPYKGKIKVVAKGVRRITSRRGGNVELLNKVKLQVFQGKSLAILTEAQSLETFPKIKSDLTLLSYASHLVEVAERLLPEEQSNPAAYNLLATALHLLERNSRQIFIRAFEVKILSVLGFFSLEGLEGLERTMGIRVILEKLQSESWEEIAKVELKPDQALEVERILRYYIEKVLEGKLRSMEVLNKLRK